MYPSVQIPDNLNFYEFVFKAGQDAKDKTAIVSFAEMFVTWII